MDWAAGSRWHKAMVISLLLHSVLFTGVGYLAGQAVRPAPLPETLIELELDNDPSGPRLTSLPAAAPAVSPVVNQAKGSQLLQTTPVTEQGAQEAVVAVSTLAVVAVDSGAIASAGGTAAGSGGEPGAGITGSSSGSAESTGVAREVIPPGILSRREPNYPEKARQAGIEGTVVLTIEILANGHAGEVSVYQSSGSELLDDAAAAAVQRWRFIPAKIRGTGQSIACQTTLPVVFKLRA